MDLEQESESLTNDINTLKLMLSKVPQNESSYANSEEVNEPDADLTYISMIKDFNDSLEKKLSENCENEQIHDSDKEASELESDLKILKSFTRDMIYEPVPSKLSNLDKFMRRDSSWSSVSNQDVAATTELFSPSLSMASTDSVEWNYDLFDNEYVLQRDFHLLSENPNDANGNTLCNLLKANQKYQKFLKDRLKQIKEYTARCESLQKKAMNLLAQIGKNSSSGIKYGIASLFGGDGEMPPEHPDARLLKEKQLKMSNIFKIVKWSDKERFALAKGIRQENQKILMDKLVERIEATKRNEDLDPETVSNIQKGIEEIRRLPASQLEMNMQSLDWDKISSVYVPSRSPIDCKIQWTVNDHPLINKSEWTKVEACRLAELADKYHHHNWQKIAEELDTNRTAAQCIIYYQRNLNKNLLKSRWTEEEDKILKAAVSLYGEKSWQGVASCLEGRTGQQCLHRWQKALHPSIRHGRWTKEEDDALSAAVRLHGSKNWFKIKSYVKGRTDVQCRERWVNVLDPSLNMGPWSFEEDEKLKSVVSKYGLGKWALVSAEIETRTDNQCWRRWKTLHCDQYLKTKSRKRKSETLPESSKFSFDVEQVADTYVLESYKFNDSFIDPEDKESDSKRKPRFPKDKFKGFLQHFLVFHPHFNFKNNRRKKHIPVYSAEVSTAKAFLKMQENTNFTSVVNPGCQLDSSEIESDEFILLRNRFRSLFFWPFLISNIPAEIVEDEKE